VSVESARGRAPRIADNAPKRHFGKSELRDFKEMRCVNQGLICNDHRPLSSIWYAVAAPVCSQSKRQLVMLRLVLCRLCWCPK
jgi:hypothetical protein